MNRSSRPPVYTSKEAQGVSSRSVVTSNATAPSAHGPSKQPVLETPGLPSQQNNTPNIPKGNIAARTRSGDETSVSSRPPTQAGKDAQDKPSLPGVRSSESAPSSHTPSSKHPIRVFTSRLTLPQELVGLPPVLNVQQSSPQLPRTPNLKHPDSNSSSKTHGACRTTPKPSRLSQLRTLAPQRSNSSFVFSESVADVVWSVISWSLRISGAIRTRSRCSIPTARPVGRIRRIWFGIGSSTLL